MLNLALVKNVGRHVVQFGSVLDFGCGIGRISRFLAPQGLHGCDVNARVIEYCRAEFPDGHWVHSPMLPPLPYPDENFDLIYSFSVFSHLQEAVEHTWLAELARVGKADAIYLISVQGDWMIEATLGPDADAARQAGFWFREVHERHGTDLDFPDYYESSYHTCEWIKATWSRWFDILDIIKGDDPARYLTEGMAFQPVGDVAPLRPMGQDLVVARKRADCVARNAAGGA